MIHREHSEERRKMKICGLCTSLAKMYCESDQAILCWDCDSKVHGANFLVAKHSRTLLCHLCQSPTSWIGSGPKLGPAISVCHDCVKNGSCIEERKKEERSDDLDEDGDDETEDDDSDDLDEEDDGDEENQVVPWSSKPFPMVASSSTSQESSSGICHSRANASQSRTAAPASHDGGCCSFSQQGNMNWPNASSTFSPLTDHKSTK